MICVPVVASIGNEYNDENITIIFNENTQFNEVQKQNIINHFINDGHESTRGIWCIFGHNLIKESVTALHHRVYAVQPRCVYEIFILSACTRCDYTNVERISSERIFCCP